MKWNLYPRQNSIFSAPHGNVSDISSWEDYEKWENHLPISLFLRKNDEKLEISINRLNNWTDFIWSDDQFPWVTGKSMNLISHSDLTGIDFQETLIVDIDGINFDEFVLYSPDLIYRCVFVLDIEGNNVDFCQDENGLLKISNGALEWFKDKGWNNYDVEKP